MYCPRLDHNVRLNPDSTVSLCGHMVMAPRFATYSELQNSDWLAKLRDEFAQNQWPKECERCRLTEQATGVSIRTNMLKVADEQSREDWLMVGGVLDNVCNSACQTCNANHSTRIGALAGTPVRVDNTSAFAQLPQERITHLDISGGEPSYSKNYKNLLANLPPNVRELRLNTNCSTVLTELSALVDKGIKVTVTVSFDGVGSVHEYLRWPISWPAFENNLKQYGNMPVNLNCWTTVSALNINNVPEIFEYMRSHNLNHSWAPLTEPAALDIRYSNHFTERAKQSTDSYMTPFKDLLATRENNQTALDEYIKQQDAIRGIDIKDYL